MTNDLFEDMRNRIGCVYISDLPYCKRAVWTELKRFPLSDYPEEQKQDFFRYVFHVDYHYIKKFLHFS